MDSLWSVLFKLNLILLGIFVVSVPFLEPGTSSFVAAIMSLAVVLFSLGSLWLLMQFGWTPFEEHL